MPYSYRLALIPCVLFAALLPPDAARSQTPKSSEASKGESSKRLVYIDTDTANEVDDPFAIYRAIVAPEFHVVGLSSAGWSNPASFGANTRTSQKMNEELLGLLNLTDRISHPIGALKPMPGAATPVDSPAARDIIVKANAMPSAEKLQVFVLGCYTNVASALLLDPSIKDKISVHLMGFNFLDNQLTPSEFNSLGDQVSKEPQASTAPAVISKGKLAHSYQAFPDACRLQNGDILVAFFAGYRHASLSADDFPLGGRDLTGTEMGILKACVPFFRAMLVP